jgi:Fe-S oxidoreductase
MERFEAEPRPHKPLDKPVILFNADQIRAANVKQVATACLSCHRQLQELVKHYDLKAKVHTVVAMAEEALI